MVKSVEVLCTLRMLLGVVSKAGKLIQKDSSLNATTLFHTEVKLYLNFFILIVIQLSHHHLM